MERLITKYERFLRIMAANPKQIAVPTLDVDLAWHTHQLSPQAYYSHVVAKMQRFIDHDDKISEDKLTASFEWTSKTYQDMFGLVYSACTCWYCESVRTSHVSSVRSMFGTSRHEKSKSVFCCHDNRDNVPNRSQSRKHGTNLARPNFVHPMHQLTSRLITP
jgi:hypothetical protein